MRKLFEDTRAKGQRGFLNNSDKDLNVTDRITIYTDGGSRGNPGPGGAAYILKDKHGNVVGGRGCYLKKTTNNIAEYTALLGSLKAAAEMGLDNISIYSDSELMVKQINGQYKVKNSNLKKLYSQCMELLSGIKSWQINHVRREKNEEADALANRAMDIKGNVEAIIKASVKPAATHKKLRLGVMLSGGGTTMVNIQTCIDDGTLNAEIAVVISSRSNVKGVERARQIGIEPVIFRKKDHPDVNDLSNRIAEELDKAKVDLVIQAGWLCLWHIPKQYENRVMNIHPALLPSFGGQGMWGHHVHEAVLKSGCKVSGCTVHFCTNEYDKGPVIVQRSCEVKDDDDADSLAARVFEQECIAYPEAIRLFAEGKLAKNNS